MKIIFIDHIGSFTKDIIQVLSKKHEVIIIPKEYVLDVNNILDKEKPDVVWFEWCDQPLIQASHRHKGSYKVINRLHSYELFSSTPQMVNWEYVDKILFVASHTKKMFELNYPSNIPKEVLYNGVDINKFAFKENKVYNNNLAFIGDLNHKKNIHLLFQCFASLPENKYALHIAGRWQDDRLKYNIFDFINKTNLQNIFFYDYVTDIPKWLEDKTYIVSTSLFESFQYSIMEGMACGCLPIVYYWYGAEEFYPVGCLFSKVRNFIEIIECYTTNKESSLVFTKNNRKLIEEKFSLDIQIKNIERILDDLHNSNISKESKG